MRLELAYLSGEYQHALVGTEIDKKEIRNVVRKTCGEKRDKFGERGEDKGMT